MVLMLNEKKQWAKVKKADDEPVEIAVTKIDTGAGEVGGGGG